jgi:hypothetical protein
MTPAKAIERLRLEAAREQVESGVGPIESIAANTGFGDPERMRRAFARIWPAAAGIAPDRKNRTPRMRESATQPGALSTSRKTDADIAPSEGDCPDEWRGLAFGGHERFGRA